MFCNCSASLMRGWSICDVTCLFICETLQSLPISTRSRRYLLWVISESNAICGIPSIMKRITSSVVRFPRFTHKQHNGALLCLRLPTELPFGFESSCISRSSSFDSPRSSSCSSIFCTCVGTESLMQEEEISFSRWDSGRLFCFVPVLSVSSLSLTWKMPLVGDSVPFLPYSDHQSLLKGID